LKSALDQIWILLVNLPCRAESNNNDSNNFMDHSALSIIFLHWKLKIERWKREPFCLLVLNWLVPYIDHESSRFLPGSSSNMSKYNIGMCLPILSFPWRWFLFIILFFFLLFPEGSWDASSSFSPYILWRIHGINRIWSDRKFSFGIGNH
jgi:hypothetical protein